MDRHHQDCNSGSNNCLVRLTEPKDSGMGALGPWEPVGSAFTPGPENEFRKKWLQGVAISITV